jgi:transcriptional regulator with XRE-family HTH domain
MNGMVGRPPANEGPEVGELLRRARKSRGLTLEQIANETRIPRRHLEALEHDDFAVVPAGFYRRAKIRMYARALNLDQSLALAELDRAEPVPELPRSQKPAFSRQRVLIVIGVVVAAAVFGRARGGREPGLHVDAHVRSVIDSPQRSAPPVRETPPDAVVETSRPIQLDPVAPLSTPSEGVLAVGIEATGARASAASNGVLAVTTEQAEARVSADSVTELVVTTQPAGARVTVNGVGWGLAPLTIRYLPAGDKRIRVSKEGYASEERMVNLAEGRLSKLDIRLRSAP